MAWGLLVWVDMGMVGYGIWTWTWGGLRLDIFCRNLCVGHQERIHAVRLIMIHLEMGPSLHFRSWGIPQSRLEHIGIMRSERFPNIRNKLANSQYRSRFHIASLSENWNQSDSSTRHARRSRLARLFLSSGHTGHRNEVCRPMYSGCCHGVSLGNVMSPAACMRVVSARGTSHEADLACSRGQPVFLHMCPVCDSPFQVVGRAY